MSMPNAVQIVEVGPRDGLQNENVMVATDIKVELINRLADAGLRSIEVGSFVSPKWVPQMADTADVLRQIDRYENVSYSVLVPNKKGLAAALACGVKEIAIFVTASEAFSWKNINCGIEESLVRLMPVFDIAREKNVKVRGYVSCVLGCPYQGDVKVEDVARLAGRIVELGCYQVSLGDTIGIGTPLKAARMVDAVLEHVAADRIALHFHDTYGQALANIYACLDRGVSVFDSSVAGIGGCPYAKGATGNVATEEIIYMLHGMGIATGVDLEKLVDTAEFLSRMLCKASSSRVARALTKGRVSDDVEMAVTVSPVCGA